MGANKPIEDIEATLLAATKLALDELAWWAHATMAAKAAKTSWRCESARSIASPVLPAAVDRDLVAYGQVLARETGQGVVDPAKLIAPMLARFMAADRAFAKLRRAVAS